MWEINNTNQITGFLYAVILGIFFAIIYDILRAFRIIKNHTSFLVFIEDAVYFLIISPITFIFFLSITAGEVRGYILIGILLGFTAFFMFVSRYSLKLFCVFLNIIKRVLIVFNKWFYLIFDKLDLFVTNFLKNTLKCFKKGLKMLVGLLYTNRK